MKVPASGVVLGKEEKEAMHVVVESGWLTSGKVNDEFESRLSKFTGIKHVRTCNSGSSANLLAVAAMVESGYWKAGDEIITTACGFPTTVNPLLLYELVPVFVDVELGTYNISEEIFRPAINVKLNPKVNGTMLAHTLGNPFPSSTRWNDGKSDGKGMPAIEDCCDALGSTYKDLGDRDTPIYHVGQQASISTCSFFPAHHITTGEGGAVFSSNHDLIRKIESIRDWGRDCYCQPGQNNTCGKRFSQQHGDLPYGFDHKYTFTHLGYNLKLNEVGAACGVEQMKKLPDFVQARKDNFKFLWNELEGLQDKIILPRATEGSDPSWFGFPITIKEEGLRDHLQKFLMEREVDSRLLFGGNLTKQPYMKGRKFRVSGDLKNADKIMNDSFWIGLHPQLSEEQLAYSAEMIKLFFGGGFD